MNPGFRQRLRTEPTIGGWCTLASPFAAELMGRSGFDWVCVDMQHGLAGHTEMTQMLLALGATGTPGLVRTGWNSPGEIMRALDAGAAGVIVPMVETAEQAAAAAAACRYPPAGHRSWGPVRAALGGPYSAASADASVACIVMIETRAGVENLDAIASTPGVDAVYVGPNDLALAHRMAPTQDPTEALHVELIERILDRCHGNGIGAGIHCPGPAVARRWLDRGFDFVTAATDGGLLRAGAAATLGELNRPGVSG